MFKQRDRFCCMFFFFFRDNDNVVIQFGSLFMCLAQKPNMKQARKKRGNNTDTYA
jgi:hypothetical protein